MKILIVCGAGASSTFVAQRVRKTAESRGLDVRVSAGSESTLDVQLPGNDVVLVGSHLGYLFADIERQASAAGVASALLSPAVFAAKNGDEALDAAITAVAANPA